MTRRRFHPAGFTLVELMISIAIVLILMLGINFVFSMSAKTISTGMALMNVNRDLRAARAVMTADFDNAENLGADEVPALIIQSQDVVAFESKQDKLNDDGNVNNFDVDGNPNNGDEQNVLPNEISFRRHRIDRISFFARDRRGEYPRQTGSDTDYMPLQGSNDAWITYGFLAIGNDAWNAFQYPTTWNIASDWILGRTVMLVIEPSTPAQQDAYTGTTNLQPFQRTSTSLIARSTGYPAGNWQIRESRFDVCRTTLQDFTSRMENYLSTWSTANNQEASYNDVWMSPVTAATVSMNYVFAAKPFTSRTNQGAGGQSSKPIAEMSTEMSLAAPIFLRGCTQFVVEFAGDFYDQGPDAAGVAEPVGTVDYDIAPAAQGGGRRIRWYGMPRDVNGDVNADNNNFEAPTAGAGTGDIAPIASYFVGVAGAPTYNNPLPRWKNPDTGNPPIANPVQSPPNFEHLYGATRVWAWGPAGERDEPIADKPTAVPPVVGQRGHPWRVRPSLIRVILQTTDQNGRLGDAQRLEMVFSVPSK